MYRLLFIVLLISLVTACGSPTGNNTASAPAATGAPPTAAPAAKPTEAAKPAAPSTAPVAKAQDAPKAAQPTPAAGGGHSSAPASTGAIKLTLVPEESEARYLVREQLAQRNLPNDAIGKTKKVTGSLVIDPNGVINRAESKFSVDMASIQTDSGMRDNFMRGNILQTSRFPTAEFVPTEVKGLSTPLPTSGDVQFQLVGDMTILGVTKPLTWDVTAKIDGKTLTGQAKTAFKFADFNITQPRVPSVLSIEDNIRLELDFKLAA